MYPLKLTLPLNIPKIMIVIHCYDFMILHVLGGDDLNS